MTKSTKTPKEYLKGPYARVLIPDSETGTYAALIREFPGCVAQGNTVQEATSRLESAAESWIQSCLDVGQPIPEPMAARQYSGKVVLRLPRSLHHKAVEMAEAEKTSLNTLLVAAVASHLEIKKAAMQPTQLVLSHAQIVITVNATVNAFNAPPSEYHLETSASAQGPVGTTTIARLRR
jgi:antitoxin HicB